MWVELKRLDTQKNAPGFSFSVASLRCCVALQDELCFVHGKAALDEALLLLLAHDAADVLAGQRVVARSLQPRLTLQRLHHCSLSQWRTHV